MKQALCLILAHWQDNDPSPLSAHSILTERSHPPLQKNMLTFPVTHSRLPTLWLTESGPIWLTEKLVYRGYHFSHYFCHNSNAEDICSITEAINLQYSELYFVTFLLACLTSQDNRMVVSKSRKMQKMLAVKMRSIVKCLLAFSVTLILTQWTLTLFLFC